MVFSPSGISRSRENRNIPFVFYTLELLELVGFLPLITLENNKNKRYNGIASSESGAGERVKAFKMRYLRKIKKLPEALIFGNDLAINYSMRQAKENESGKGSKMITSKGYEGIEISGSDSIETIERKMAEARIVKIELEIQDLSLMKNEALEAGITGSSDIRASLRDRKIEALENELFNLLSIAS